MKTKTVSMSQSKINAFLNQRKMNEIENSFAHNKPQEREKWIFWSGIVWIESALCNPPKDIYNNFKLKIFS